MKNYDCDRSMIPRLIRQIAPRYLVVRDMMYHSANEYAWVPKAEEERIRRLLPQRQIADFESRWGSIGRKKNLAHFILKYKYTENWERECAENYFSYTLEDLNALLDPDGIYTPVLMNRYILPWCRYDAQNTLGIEPGHEMTTHFSLILSCTGKQDWVSLDEDI